MDGNIVKLEFQSIAQGSGFAKVSADTAALRKNLGRVGHAVNLLGQAMGDIGHMAGGAFSAVLRGNFWELGAIAIHETISLVKEHNKLLRDARLAARGLSADYNSLEKRAEGYRQRVAEWRKAKEEADAAEAKAADAMKRAADLIDRGKIKQGKDGVSHGAGNIQVDRSDPSYPIVRCKGCANPSGLDPRVMLRPWSFSCTESGGVRTGGWHRQVCARSTPSVGRTHRQQTRSMS